MMKVDLIDEGLQPEGYKHSLGGKQELVFEDTEETALADETS